jgi:hypothetical protein
LVSKVRQGHQTVEAIQVAVDKDSHYWVVGTLRRFWQGILVLADRRPLPFVPIVGQLGLYTPPPDVMAKFRCIKAKGRCHRGNAFFVLPVLDLDPRRCSGV